MTFTSCYEKTNLWCVMILFFSTKNNFSCESAKRIITTSLNRKKYLPVVRALCFAWKSEVEIGRQPSIYSAGFVFKPFSPLVCLLNHIMLIFFSFPQAYCIASSKRYISSSGACTLSLNTPRISVEPFSFSSAQQYFMLCKKNLSFSLTFSHHGIHNFSWSFSWSFEFRLHGPPHCTYCTGKLES